MRFCASPSRAAAVRAGRASGARPRRLTSSLAIRPVPRIPASSWSRSALAEPTDAGADEALLLDMRGYIAECAYSNVFVVRGGALLTPALEAGILPGITRATVLELARAGGIAVSETSLEPAV